ncbi:hypothetical protein HNQ02_002930 [Flavobacterium sp. 7E]|uniref:hypothetical protein n=1 Tax=Flavobacterium sp. 7E TaxID=2735898 RepID=UPI00156E594D|nr:hypothetical protein [Flavobacterium sp. 7E]NRS89995.1 hypothetical protein [Flavobacterium sp. 7E]
MKKVMCITLSVICIIFIIVIVFYNMLIVSPNIYNEKQDDYFSNNTNSFRGNVYEFEYLGGGYCLLKINIIDYQINNIVDNNDNFIGLLSKETNNIILLADFNSVIGDWYEPLEDNRVQKINLDIRLNSIKRKIYYSKNHKIIGETDLRIVDIYTHYLIEAQKKQDGFVRF